MHRVWSLILAAVCLAAAGSDGIRKFQLGDTEVISIQDAVNAMPVSIFHGGKIRTAAKTVPASVNVFLVRNGNDWIMIDAGYGGKRGALAAKLRRLNIRPEAVRTILLTHTHFDHVGGLTENGKPCFPNAKIYLSKPEYAFGTGGEPSGAILKTCEKQLVRFRFGETPVPGITARAAAGHTPGHTVFESGNLRFIGDLIHGAALQFADPAICARYDQDVKQATAARRAVLKEAADSSALILGAHLPFPGIGYVHVAPGKKDDGTARGASFLFLPYDETPGAGKTLP